MKYIVLFIVVFCFFDARASEPVSREFLSIDKFCVSEQAKISDKAPFCSDYRQIIAQRKPFFQNDELAAAENVGELCFWRQPDRDAQLAFMRQGDSYQDAYQKSFDFQDQSTFCATYRDLAVRVYGYVLAPPPNS